jgi:hypothetical protein
MTLEDENVFRLRLNLSKSASLGEIGKEFQSPGAQVEKALPPNDLSLKDCSDRRIGIGIEIVYLIKRPSRGKYNYELYVQDSDLKNDKAYL